MYYFDSTLSYNLVFAYFSVFKEIKFYLNVNQPLGRSVKNSSIKNPKTHAHLHIISYHRKEIYIISNEFDKRCKRSCGDKISDGKS